MVYGVFIKIYLLRYVLLRKARKVQNGELK